MKKVALSFLNSKNVEDDIIRINSSSADYIHVDVGDGLFIERKFHPIKELSELNSALTKRLDVHLMVEDPDKYIDDYSMLNTEYITIHCEIKKDILRLLEKIKSYGIKPGLAINPDTDIAFLEPFLDDINMIIIMAAFPGKGGQSFIYSTVDKVKEIKEFIGDRNIILSVDCGINEETSKLVDTDMVVSGTFVLGSENIEEAINKVR